MVKLSDKSHHTDARAICLNCLHSIDAATGLTDDFAPDVGDIGICIYCANVGKFNDMMSLESISVEELDEIEDESPETFNEIATAVIAIKRMRGIDE